MLCLNRSSDFFGIISQHPENVPDAINRIVLSEKKALTNFLLAPAKKLQVRKLKKMKMKIPNKNKKLNNSKMNLNNQKKKENKNI